MPELIEWEDFFAMIEDVHQHVRTTQRPVELSDDPKRLRLGYSDPKSDKTWRIRLTNVKGALMPEALGDREPTSFQREAMQLMRSSEGRLQLANQPLNQST